MHAQEAGIDEILALAEKLSVQEKAKLVEKLLGNSGLAVVLGNNNMPGQMIAGHLVVQINAMGKDELKDELSGILRAIANRIDPDKE